MTGHDGIWLKQYSALLPLADSW